MINIFQVASALNEFERLIQSLKLKKLISVRVGQIRKWEDLSKQEWAWSPGIYLFFQNDSLKYVGRALSTTLAGRIFDQINARSDPNWAAVIDDPNTVIAVLSLEKEESFWAASLESFLIGRFRKEIVNRRIG